MHRHSFNIIVLSILLVVIIGCDNSPTSFDDSQIAYITPLYHITTLSINYYIYDARNDSEIEGGEYWRSYNIHPDESFDYDTLNLDNIDEKLNCSTSFSEEMFYSDDKYSIYELHTIGNIQSKLKIRQFGNNLQRISGEVIADSYISISWEGNQHFCQTCPRDIRNYSSSWSRFRFRVDSSNTSYSFSFNNAHEEGYYGFSLSRYDELEASRDSTLFSSQVYDSETVNSYSGELEEGRMYEFIASNNCSTGLYDKMNKQVSDSTNISYRISFSRDE